MHLKEAEERGQASVLQAWLEKDSLTPSHDAKDGKVSALPIASSEKPMDSKPPHVVDEA